MNTCVRVDVELEGESLAHYRVSGIPIECRLVTSDRPSLHTTNIAVDKGPIKGKPQAVPLSKVVQKVDTPFSSLGCREAESSRDQRTERSGFSFSPAVPSTAISHSSHPSPCDGRWGVYSGAAVISFGRSGRAVPEQLLMTEGMRRTRRSDRVAHSKIVIFEQISMLSHS